ncbi:MAG: methylenetetrahydrofolate reductase, partial [Gammaproteobacteria bacterium]|nr:methylenetetrahydrofolate reductase [Gammaproteobacteria bacterium]
MQVNNVSFEFFPPKTAEGMQTLLHTAEQLNVVKPEFFSVTFGAGGSTRAGTTEAVFNLQSQLSVAVAPHISGIASSADEIRELLGLYV